MKDERAYFLVEDGSHRVNSLDVVGSRTSHLQLKDSDQNK